MRTTLDIAEDVLLAAKELARREKRTAGEVLSELARRGLGVGPAADVAEPTALYGFVPAPRRGRAVTNALIDELLDDEG